MGTFEESNTGKQAWLIPVEVRVLYLLNIAFSHNVSVTYVGLTFYLCIYNII